MVGAQSGGRASGATVFGMVKVSIKKNDPTESVSTFIGGRIRPSARTGGQPPPPRDFLGIGSENHLFITRKNIPILAQGETEEGSVGTQPSEG